MFPYELLPSDFELLPSSCGQGRIRTSEGVCRQIYSLMRLTTSLPARVMEFAALGNRFHMEHGERSHTDASPWKLLISSWRADSDRRPADYKSAALPTELRQRTKVPLLQNAVFRFEVPKTTADQ